MREMTSVVPKGNKPHDIRNNNQRAFVQLLYQQYEMTIPEIAERLSLSRTAASKIAKELTDQKLLRSIGKRDSTQNGGRPPTLLTVNRNYKYVVTVLINPLDFCCALMDMWYEPRLQIHQVFTEEALSDHSAMVLAVADAIDRVMKEMDLSEQELCGVAVMVKGIVDVQSGIFVFPIGTMWEANMPVREELAKVLGFEVPFFMDNACRYMGYAELISSPTYHRELFMVIASGPYGVGGCVVDHGNLIHGANGFVGEIGHMIVDPFSKSLCDCGSFGCLEALVSTKATFDYVLEFAAEYPESVLAKGASLSEQEIFDAADRGDTLACKVMDRIAFYLAIGIHNIMVAVDPHRIVLEGRFCLMGDYFLNKLRKELAPFPKFISDNPTKIVFSSYRGVQGELVACMKGAACYVINQYLQDRESQWKLETRN